MSNDEESRGLGPPSGAGQSSRPTVKALSHHVRRDVPCARLRDRREGVGSNCGSTLAYMFK